MSIIETPETPVGFDFAANLSCVSPEAKVYGIPLDTGSAALSRVLCADAAFKPVEIEKLWTMLSRLVQCEDLLTLRPRLANPRTFVVGGFLRDIMKGYQPKDVDLALVRTQAGYEMEAWPTREGLGILAESLPYDIAHASVHGLNLDPFSVTLSTGAYSWVGQLCAGVNAYQLTLRTAENIESLIRGYDWNVCQVALGWVPTLPFGVGGGITTHVPHLYFTETFVEGMLSDTLEWSGDLRDRRPGSSLKRVLSWGARGQKWKLGGNELHRLTVAMLDDAVSRMTTDEVSWVDESDAENPTPDTDTIATYMLGGSTGS